MRRVFFTLLIGFIFSAQANACPRTPRQLICPGDQVVSNNNVRATVLGINPFKGTAAIQTPGGTTFTVEIPTLAVGFGCLEMYCYGDRIVSEENIVGTIIGVNPYTLSIAAQTPSGTVFTRRVESLALGLGCAYGACVADGIISSENIIGTVIGVNAYKGFAASQTPGGTVFTRPIDTLANTKYCADYGAYPRSLTQYPVLDKELFISPDLKFSFQRPQLR